jgi:hypothetical protein
VAAWTGGGRISNKADVRAALHRINTTAQTRGTTALLPRAVQTANEVALSAPDLSRLLPADPQLLPLLPWPGGVRRGATLTALGSYSLLMLLLAGALRDTGSWAAVVGMRDFGYLAAVQGFGVPSDRLEDGGFPIPAWTGPPSLRACSTASTWLSCSHHPAHRRQCSGSYRPAPVKDSQCLSPPGRSPVPT